MSSNDTSGQLDYIARRIDRLVELAEKRAPGMEEKYHETPPFKDPDERKYIEGVDYSIEELAGRLDGRIDDLARRVNSLERNVGDHERFIHDDLARRVEEMRAHFDELYDQLVTEGVIADCRNGLLFTKKPTDLARRMEALESLRLVERVEALEKRLSGEMRVANAHTQRAETIEDKLARLATTVEKIVEVMRAWRKTNWPPNSTSEAIDRLLAHVDSKGDADAE